MNIHELNYVLCIAKYQNITKAAQELYISQPTLSKYLKRLERDLNIKLFNRIDSCYIPTYAGRRYMEYAKKMLELSGEWEKELEDMSAENAGELNIAFPLMRSSCMIPWILPAFQKNHPGIQVKFFEETYGIQKLLLTDDQIDFAIFSESSPNSRLEYEVLGTERILLAVPGTHPLAKGQKKLDDAEGEYPEIDWKKLDGEKMILHFPEQTTGTITEQLLKKHGIVPLLPFYTRNTQAALLLVQQEQGICFAPETYVRNMKFSEPPVCFSLNDPEAFTSTMLAYRKGAYLSHYALDFIQIAKDYFGEYTKVEKQRTILSRENSSEDR